MACLGCCETFLVETSCPDPIWLSRKVAGEINADEYSVTYFVLKKRLN